MKAQNWKEFKDELSTDMKVLNNELQSKIKCENARPNSKEYGIIMHAALNTTNTLINNAAESHIDKEFISNNNKP